MATRSLPLTKKINVTEGSHILYFYRDAEQYIENVISFIQSAIELNQKVVYIDNFTNYAALNAKFGSEIKQMIAKGSFEYISNYEFYEMYGDFHFERVLNNFKSTVQPYVDKQQSVRVWGHVDWSEQENILDKLHTYECECDLTVSEIGFMTVCCYNGREVPAYIQTEMMRSHEYFMTDNDLVKSSLYNQSKETIFPSLSTQKKIESDVDFYKQKLDFIHVVAHEVRNPLTVIKSFAAILKSEIEDESKLSKLSLIEDYSVAIDHEIHHIIQTEQMITTDSFWKLKLVKLIPILDEVIEIMTIKGRTQNIHLRANIDIPNNIIVRGNIMGYKLIISNLLSNAIKYSSENDNVYFYSYVEDNHIVLEVKDEGIGMSKEQLDKLFTKYQKMHEEHSGQGIGLYMVNKLVHHFNGTIKVKSALGKGTTIKITFPK
ncbi:MEDS domain-containing protein [Evansella cellulosilytica]|uniref:histidine kinase n=1 Tax=Evansella cellulosilytica (strain ATCC 21833 / DSM 2522 / FERM P-1141 / JCM 9156 / N-4) TaxID=649639 RepID=E6TUB6_EVAC2|nr:MEDS domain-containing protein [Evansella cellulosilytica]ADU29672.1 histidine kinase [Evansella cellulosilytica DSM 2522]